MTVPENDLQNRGRARNRFVVRALIGTVLIAVGFLMVLPRPYRERTFRIEAGGCRMDTTVVEPVGATSSNTGFFGALFANISAPIPDRASAGTVVLLHGLAANRKLMSYIAHGFANLGLRVYVPDLPGHGHTAGPYSAARDEECSENLLHELRSRGLAPPESTLLVGHSM